jgi:hypothetical protein
MLAAKSIGSFPQSLTRHCEEPTGLAYGKPDDRLRDEAIYTFFAA